MSLEQLRTYLMTDEAKKDLVEKAREAGYEVVEEDLKTVTGGLSLDIDTGADRLVRDPAGSRFEKPCDEGRYWKEPDEGKPYCGGCKE